MVIYSREKVARLREQYPAETRICLDSMDGEAGMPQGLEGTVQYVYSGDPEIIDQYFGYIRRQERWQCRS